MEKKINQEAKTFNVGEQLTETQEKQYSVLLTKYPVELKISATSKSEAHELAVAHARLEGWEPTKSEVWEEENLLPEGDK